MLTLVQVTIANCWLSRSFTGGPKSFPDECCEWISLFLLVPHPEEDPSISLRNLVQTNRLPWLRFLLRQRQSQFLVHRWQFEDFKRAIGCAVRQNSCEALKLLFEASYAWPHAQQSTLVLSRVWWEACQHAVVTQEVDNKTLLWLLELVAQVKDKDNAGQDTVHDARTVPTRSCEIHKMAQLASFNGRLALVQLLCKPPKSGIRFSNNGCCYECVLDSAVRSGQQEIADWLLRQIQEPGDPHEEDVSSTRTQTCCAQPVSKEEEQDATKARIHFLSCERLKLTRGNIIKLCSMMTVVGVQGFEWIGNKNPKLVWDPQLLVMASAAGKAEVVSWLLERLRSEHRPGDHEAHQQVLRTLVLDAFRIACARGHLEVVKIFVESEDKEFLCSEAPRVRAGLEQAVANGHVAVVRWLCGNHHTKISSQAIDDAARAGHVDMVQWLDPQFPSRAFAGEILATAAKKGNIRMLRFLLRADHHEPEPVLVHPDNPVFVTKANGSRTTSIAMETCERALHHAIVNGHVQAVEFLYAIIKQRINFWDKRLSIRNLMDPIHRASQAGYLKVIVWLLQQTTGKLTAKNFSVVWKCAARKDDLELITLLHERRAGGFSSATIDAAARTGSLRVIRFLHQRRKESCSTDAMDDAASGGFLDVVRFLHEHRSEGCTFRAMDSACANGHYRVVQFLQGHRQEGCSFNAFEQAASEGHLRILKLLFAGHAMQSLRAQDQKLLVHLVWRVACQKGHLPIVQWLLSKKCNVNLQLGLRYSLEHTKISHDLTDSFTMARKRQLTTFLEQQHYGSSTPGISVLPNQNQTMERIDGSVWWS